MAGQLWAFGINANEAFMQPINISSPVQTVTGGTNWSIVGSGNFHTASTKTDGTLWLWGTNSYGSLGNNSILSLDSPVQTISFGTNWSYVEGGGNYCAAIKTDGTLWTWGQNTSGQLGDNTTIHRSSPVQTIAGGNNWSSVSCGTQHTAAIKNDGTLWMWGQNSFGELGDNTITIKSSPVQTVAFGTNWNSVSCGNGFTAAIKKDGTLWMWGSNGQGRIGDNTTTNRSSPIQTIAFGTNWSSVSCVGQFVGAIKTDGTLWCWGYNIYGQLGDNTSVSRSSPVQTITGGTNWSKISCGGNHIAAIKTDGTLWCWGYNYGALGDNTVVNKSSPIQTVAGGVNWSTVSCGYFYTAATKTDGTLWLWGAGSSGQLGIDKYYKYSPSMVDSQTNWLTTNSSKHTGFKAAIKTDGTLWLWGTGGNGQLGNNTVVSVISPVQTISDGTNWRSFSTGGTFCAAIKTDGTLWTWGNNNNGYLGDGTGTSRSSPVQTVTYGNIWNYVDCGQQHTAAIKTDGTLWMWGRNQFGNLGDNTALSKSSPIQTVAFGNNWQTVSCNLLNTNAFTAAIKTDGTLWMWGRNLSGQLGDNTVVNKSSPIQTITGGTNWSSVACGNNHVAAIKKDGTLWAWGINSSGQLGDNTLIQKSSPVQTVAGGTDWISVFCGANHTLATKKNGTIWGWGINTGGQLDGSGISQSSPIQIISSATTWYDLQTSANNSFFILENNPNKLSINTQPQAGTASSQLIVQPIINIGDSAGSVVRTAINSVSVAVQSGSATISGTTTVAAVSGVATFTDLVLTGSGYIVLRFTSSGLTSTDSISFTVNIFLPIIPKRSEVSGKLPTSSQLNIGELAVNITDKKGYVKKSDGTIVNLFNGTVYDGGTF
jgi:alpha-tubulin suppressor-like RCC1 family protein